jgi:hypothetical protein
MSHQLTRALAKVHVGEKAERREAMLKAEMERERKECEQAEKRFEQLENVVERMGRGELPVPGHGASSTSMRGLGDLDLMTDGMMGLSSIVAMASKAQQTGKTFTEVYADHVRLQEEYAMLILKKWISIPDDYVMNSLHPNVRSTIWGPHSQRRMLELNS